MKGKRTSFKGGQFHNKVQKEVKKKHLSNLTFSFKWRICVLIIITAPKNDDRLNN